MTSSAAGSSSGNVASRTSVATLLVLAAGWQGEGCCVIVWNGGSSTHPPASGICTATGAAAAAAHKAALDAVASLPKRLGNNAKAFGFLPSDNLAQAKLGEPFCRFTLPFDAVLTYAPGSSPKPYTKLVDNGSLYPLLLDGAVRSSLIVEYLDGTWQVTGIGGAKRTPAFVKMRESLAAKSGSSPESVFIVRIAGLDISFLALDKSADMQLQAAVSVPEADIDPQDPPIPADNVLLQLKPVAQQAQVGFKKSKP